MFIVWLVLLVFVLGGWFYFECPKYKKSTKQKEDSFEYNKIIESRDKQIATLQSNILDIEKQLIEILKEITLDKEEQRKLTSQYNSQIGRLQQKVSILEHIIDNCPIPVEIVINAQPDNPDKYMLWYSCERKVPYDTREEAEEAKVTLGEKYNKTFKVYHCRYCNKWHLATQLTF